MKKILITDMDGFNVHRPDNTAKYVRFLNIKKAKSFAMLVKIFGWAKANKILKFISEE